MPSFAMLLQQRKDTSTPVTAHAPELPRVYLDTRMPAAPAQGGRVIVVGPPRPRPRRADLAVGTAALAAVLLLTLLFRWARHRGPG